MNQTTLGIIGGMGSYATAYYFNALIHLAQAKKDQDYPRIIVDNHAQIEDRTAALLHNGPSPVEKLKESVELLNHANVDMAMMPCFTAHSFYNDMMKEADFELVDVFDVLQDFINKHPHIKKIGILATNGTQEIGLFEQLNNITLIYPDEPFQQKIMDAIHHPTNGIKSKHTTLYSTSLLNEVSDHLVEKGVDVILSGCTEIGVVQDYLNHQLKRLDPMMLVVEHIINKTRE